MLGNLDFLFTTKGFFGKNVENRIECSIIQIKNNILYSIIQLEIEQTIQFS